MSYDKQRYLELLSKNRFEEATVYRADNMPDVIYKYFSLSDTKICDFSSTNCNIDSSLNEKRLKSLRDNTLWLSDFRELNDPFEYKSVYLDYEKLSSIGCSNESAELFFNKIKNSYVVSSFTNNGIDSMPMWAHYGNNHQGYCVKYKVENRRIIFPMAYESTRTPIANTVVNFMNIINKLQNKEIGFDNKDYQLYSMLFLHNALIKHLSWEYENEYRIVLWKYKEEDKGKLYNLSELDLVVEDVYIGKNCSDENRKRIIDICNMNNFNVYDVKLTDTSNDYSLDYMSIM